MSGRTREESEMASATGKSVIVHDREAGRVLTEQVEVSNDSLFGGVRIVALVSRQR